MFNDSFNIGNMFRAKFGAYSGWAQAVSTAYYIKFYFNPVVFLFVFSGAI